MTIGVLAFQGDVIEHMQALRLLGAEAQEVRSIDDLEEVKGLIIPGGESTVIGKFLEETGLRKAIIDRCTNGKFPIYGTCAGAILLAREVFSVAAIHESRLRPLGLMDITIERNAYGRQTESFEAYLTLDLPSGKEEISGIFIRAPKVVQIGKSVSVLARYEGLPVACMEGNFLVSTFHPELSTKPSFLHKFFSGFVEK
ncbi:MAG: pyridoxal 5'-phosphate synthase glutaminase subunit PdxT [Patescibacteria group bacterium]